MTPKPEVSILIVTWNARQLLERCLPAILAQTARDNELIVVDNGSTDDTADLVATLAPKSILIRSPANLHFAAGNNLGMTRCRGRYVALLNNDCVPEPTWLERSLHAAESVRAGMVATRQLRADQPDTVDSAGIALDRAAIAWDRLGGFPADSETTAPPLFGPSAGAALYARALLEDVGPFDPGLTAYYEDVDLAWRARLRGWRCVEAPGARVLHLGSASAGRNSPQKRYLLGRNKLWVAFRNYPDPAFARYLPAILAYDLAAAAAYALAAPTDAVDRTARLAALRGRAAALRGLRHQLARRRQLQARRTAPVADILAAMAPLTPPWRLASRFAHLPEAPRTR